MSTDMTGWCALCRAGSHNTHNAALGGICVGCACPVTAADRPSVTDNARAVREAAMDLYRALRRTNPDALAEVDEVEDWTYWENIVRAAQVALAADRTETTTYDARAEAWAEGHRTGWEHCQDGNYGNDHWDDPTPNPYAAAGRPSVTDNARAEAMRRYPSDIADRGLTYPTGAVREHSRAAFVAGAEWAAGRAETTTATTEDAARVINEVLGGDMDNHARIAAHRLADAGLLATARTRPTREELIDALVMSPLSDPAGTDMRPFEQTADAVMELLWDGAR